MSASLAPSPSSWHNLARRQRRGGPWEPHLGTLQAIWVALDFNRRRRLGCMPALSTFASANFWTSVFLTGPIWQGGWVCGGRGVPQYLTPFLGRGLTPASFHPIQPFLRYTVTEEVENLAHNWNPCPEEQLCGIMPGPKTISRIVALTTLSPPIYRPAAFPGLLSQYEEHSISIWQLISTAPRTARKSLCLRV